MVAEPSLWGERDELCARGRPSPAWASDPRVDAERALRRERRRRDLPQRVGPAGRRPNGPAGQRQAGRDRPHAAAPARRRRRARIGGRRRQHGAHDLQHHPGRRAAVQADPARQPEPPRVHPGRLHRPQLRPRRAARLVRSPSPVRRRPLRRGLGRAAATGGGRRQPHRPPRPAGGAEQWA